MCGSDRDEPEPEEQRLRYVRDYDFKVMHDQVEDGQEEMVQSAAFVFDDEQDTVKYLPLLRMNCAKRGKGMRCVCHSMHDTSCLFSVVSSIAAGL